MNVLLQKIQWSKRFILPPPPFLSHSTLQSLSMKGDAVLSEAEAHLLASVVCR